MITRQLAKIQQDKSVECDKFYCIGMKTYSDRKKHRDEIVDNNHEDVIMVDDDIEHDDPYLSKFLNKNRNFRVDEYKNSKNVHSDWVVFNRFHDVSKALKCEKVMIKEYVSASAIKNYVLIDPCLDWIKTHFYNLGYNTPEETIVGRDNPHCWNTDIACLNKKIEKNSTFIEILFPI